MTITHLSQHFGRYSSHANSVVDRIAGVDSLTADWENTFRMRYVKDRPYEAHIVNHSWTSSMIVGDGGMSGIDRSALSGQLHVSGVNNGRNNAHPWMVVSPYNALTVGTANGDHSHGGTTGSYGARGRQRPHVCYSEPHTSWAAPRLTTMAIELWKLGWSNIQIIAALLTAADKPDGWSNSEEKPLDELYGSGFANLERAKEVRFGSDVSHSGGPFTATLYWLHDPDQPFKPQTLTLWRDEELHGISRSPVDNHQHIHIPYLDAGNYLLQVDGVETEYALAWT